MKKKDGYVLDTTYPTFFYKEMLPLWLNTVVSFLGFKVPDIEKPFSYLELACATGTNLLIAAINYPHGSFVGVDFNHQHIEQAKQSAANLGLKNVEFIHADFSDFLGKNNRKFDFIVNHGTFSWVSSEHQQNILDIVAQSLNDLGIFYLHYMCYPGSVDLLSVQKLLNLVDQHSQSSSVESIEIGKKLFSDLNTAGAFIHNPKIESITKTLENNHAYLAHEFLTDYWQPLYSVDVHKKVHQSTQLSYLGSANPCENMESISIPSNMQSMIRNTQAPALKEYLKDIARDAKQRIDIFQKSPQQLHNEAHFAAMNQVYFQPLKPMPQYGIKSFETPIGKIQAPKELIAAIFDELAKKPMRFADLLKFQAFKENPVFLIETIFLLMNAHYLHPVSSWAECVDQNIIKKLNQEMKKQGVSLKIIVECATAI